MRNFGPLRCFSTNYLPTYGPVPRFPSISASLRSHWWPSDIDLKQWDIVRSDPTLSFQYCRRACTNFGPPRCFSTNYLPTCGPVPRFPSVSASPISHWWPSDIDLRQWDIVRSDPTLSFQYCRRACINFGPPECFSTNYLPT